jgi:hypothetical protein
MEKMKQPTTNIQEILYTLITQGHVSIFDFPYLSGFRTRVSELKLKYGLIIETKKDTRCNKFGNQYTYCIHFLHKEHQKKAIQVYVQMSK